MKRTTRIKIMLIVVFACMIYWLNSIKDDMPTELLPNAAPGSSQGAAGGAQEIWPTDETAAPAPAGN